MIIQPTDDDMSHKHECLFHLIVEGDVGTNSSKKSWRRQLESEFSLVSPSLTFGMRLAVKIEFWIDSSRISGNRLDVDNLAKPVLDALKNAGLVYDDSLVYDVHVIKHVTTGSERVVVTVSEWWA